MTLTLHSPIAVVGAGTMGAGIAQIAAAAGHPVRVIDAAPAGLERGRAAIAAAVARGKLEGAAEARIAWTSDLSAAADAALVIEAIVENLDAKISLFNALAGVVAKDCLLASNTSSLSIDAIAAAVPGPERVLGLHFFNPVPVMKLVEVIAPSPLAEPMLALMRAWGKRPVLARDVPGFIVNRVARPYYAEGFAAWGEGIPAADVDHALTTAGGFRMGPLALADLIGHDVNYEVARTVYDAYDATRFRLQPAQAALVAAGKLGRKSKAGVYDYAVDLPPPAHVAPRGQPGIVSAPGCGFAAMIGEGVAFDDGLQRGQWRVDGHLITMGDGRLLADHPARPTVLIDAMRDLATPTLVFSAVSDDAAIAAAGFAAALGKQALRIPDRPGGLVLRTLAQLANAAADAVADGVASEADVDSALVDGANHPEGPLAWARRYGLAKLAAVLENIAAATGDPMYRPAPLLTKDQA